MIRKQVADVIKKGRDQGFLTQEDILEIFPDAENRIPELDDLYDRLLSESIDVFESVTPEETETDKSQPTQQLYSIPEFFRHLREIATNYKKKNNGVISETEIPGYNFLIK